MRKLLPYTLVLSLLWISGTAWAQVPAQKPSDSTGEKPSQRTAQQSGQQKQVQEAAQDSLRPAEPLRLENIQIGADIFNFGRGLLTQGRQHYELHSSAEVGPWVLAVDFAQSRWSESVDGVELGATSDIKGTRFYDYQNQGQFIRIGFEKNFLRDVPHVFSLGARYGLARFKEELVYNNYSNAYGSYRNTLSNEGISGRWVELTTSVKVQVFKPVMMGYTVRLKFAPNTNTDGQELMPYYIPGYGKTSVATQASFHYYIIVRLPFDKK